MRNRGWPSAQCSCCGLTCDLWKLFHCTSCRQECCVACTAWIGNSFEGAVPPNEGQCKRCVYGGCSHE